jgi:HSP20 family molecular chaperone IbpA
MAKIDKSIELEVPVHTAYNQMTQFEEFPKFMAHVRDVRQIDDTHLHWKAEIGGKEVEWDAEISEQVPDQRIAWRSTQGNRNNGEVSFTPLGENRTRVNFSVDAELPAGKGAKSGNDDLVARTEQDLQSFKRFIESRGQESGAWRGQVHGGQAQDKRQQQGNSEGLGNKLEGGKSPASFRDGASQTGGNFVRATQTAVDEASRFGKQAMEAAGDNISRMGHQATDLGNQALRGQQAVQESASQAASAATRTFRSGMLSAQPWFSAMLNAFDEPFKVMRRFSEEMNNELEQLLPLSRDTLGRNATSLSGLSSLSNWTPNIDVSHENGQFVIYADLPGMNKEDISVEVEDGKLILNGERRARHESVDQGLKRVECRYGSFTRVIPLSEEIDLQNAEASMSDGVLRISLPIIPSAQRAHRIEVRGGDEQRERQKAEGAAQSAERSSAGRAPQAQRNVA